MASFACATWLANHLASLYRPQPNFRNPPQSWPYDVARHIRRTVYSPLEPNSHRYASLCRGPVAAAAKLARQLLHPGHHRGARILVDDPPLNKISRRTALALPLGLAASSGTIYNGFAKADEPVRGGTM